MEMGQLQSRSNEKAKERYLTCIGSHKVYCYWPKNLSEIINNMILKSGNCEVGGRESVTI